MTAAAAIVAVTRAEDDSPCRGGCGRPIRAGQRAALVLGIGQVHLRCLIGPGEDQVQPGESDGPPRGRAASLEGSSSHGN